MVYTVVRTHSHQQLRGVKQLADVFCVGIGERSIVCAYFVWLIYLT